MISKLSEGNLHDGLTMIQGLVCCRLTGAKATHQSLRYSNKKPACEGRYMVPSVCNVTPVEMTEHADKKTSPGMRLRQETGSCCSVNGANKKAEPARITIANHGIISMARSVFAARAERVVAARTSSTASVENDRVSLGKCPVMTIEFMNTKSMVIVNISASVVAGNCSRMSMSRSLFVDH